MRTLTELYFKGLSAEYQGIFKCLVNLILINFDDTEDEFQKAMHIVTDYLKTYGEQIFQLMSRESRESIENGYEVTIKRHAFLGQTRRQRLIEYLTKNYFENKCLAYSNTKYEVVRLAYQSWEDNKKELSIDPALERNYMTLKAEFSRVLELVAAMADVLDQDMPPYIIEEDKSRETTMSISKKAAAVSATAAASKINTSAPAGQAV